MHKKEKWYITAKKADFAALGAAYGIDQVTARLIRNRLDWPSVPASAPKDGCPETEREKRNASDSQPETIVGLNAVGQYLYGGLDDLHDPALMKGCPEAAALLAEKIQEQKKIRIIGDYDIDGVCATYILYRAILACGGRVDYEIPDRMKDGYGLNLRLIELAYQEEVDTILTCDNGIAAIDEIAFAKEKGMTVIVTDHHEPLFTTNDFHHTEGTSEADDKKRCSLQAAERNNEDSAVRILSPAEQRIYRLPPADVIVNPHQPGCSYPYKKLCGAAVAWKVICELRRQMNSANVAYRKERTLPEHYEKEVSSQNMDAGSSDRQLTMEEKRSSSANGLTENLTDELLTFAGFATVGDVMDLDGENRILVKEGLKRLRTTNNPGMSALIRANELDPTSLTSYHIGFVLGPCINASGRLDTAKRSLRLLLSETKEEAEKIAAELKELNDERKTLTQQAVDTACAQIDSDESYTRDRVLVLYLPDCHESIAGIVAGKVRERYYKPVFVITDAHAASAYAALNAESQETESMNDTETTGKDNLAKGSGRSIEAYSMFEEMVKCQDLFLKFGGHPMAAGFSLERSRIPEMRRRLNENSTLTDDDLTEKVHIDVAMPIHYISGKVIDELSLLEPFGKGNEKPLFADTSLSLLSARIIGKNKNVVKMRVQNKNGYSIDALYFGDPASFQEYLTEKFGEHEVQNLFWGRVNHIQMDFTYYP
ncbi:MAG: DHH family phosphoesterase, partial [Lachnospiraceae bacterium]|nr:DHH family phosphoesterase [Lachnospiraceae bacterium]